MRTGNYSERFRDILITRCYGPPRIRQHAGRDLLENRLADSRVVSHGKPLPSRSRDAPAQSRRRHEMAAQDFTAARNEIGGE